MSVNFDMDDKKTKRELERMEKERLKMEKEQKKMMQEESKTEPVHKRREPKQKSPADLEKEIRFKKTIKTIIIGLIVILGAIAAKNFITNYAKASINQEDSNMIKMPNICQFEEKSAIAKLQQLGLDYKIIYEYDAFSTNGTVIRCNHNVGDSLPLGTIVTVYICDDAQPIIDYDYSFVKTQQCPFELDNLDVISFEVIDDSFYLTIQNNNDCIISTITYTIGYADSKSSKIGQRTYFEIIDNKLMPGEKYTLSQAIDQPETEYLSVLEFYCDASAAPSSDR